MKKIDLWPIKITVAAFIISMIMAIVTNGFSDGVNIVVAFLILLLVILLGIIFDILGLAVTIADETPFHSRSTRGLKGSPEAIKLIRNAGKVSSFCNDVIGDIAGVLSGGLAASIAVSLFNMYPLLPATFISMLLTAIVSALTVGGKAAGKGVAKKYCDTIVMNIAVIIHYAKNVFSFRKRDR